MNVKISAVFGLCAMSVCASVSAAETNETPMQVAQRNRAYVEKYASSLATVRYFTKKNADGEEFKARVPYKCPNCGETHWRTDEAASEKNIPAEFAGFLIAPDRVLMQDIRVKPEFVSRIEVEVAGETIAATESESCVGRDALILKTEKPFAGGKPLTFTGKEPKVSKYFYMTREDGETLSGVKSSKAPELVYHVEAGKMVYEGNPNTLVLDEEGNAVTVAMQTEIELGDETFSSPLEWETEPAAKRFEALDALTARLRKSVLPLYLQLEAKGKDESGRFGRISRWSSSDEAGDDRDCVCVVLENGTVLVPVALDPNDTARLVKMEATLPDGAKAELEFVGSLDTQGALIARFKGEAKGVEPLKFDRRPVLEHFRENVFSVAVLNRGGGKLDVKTNRSKVDGFSRVKNNETVVSVTRVMSGDYDDFDNAKAPFRLCVTERGEILALSLSDRKQQRSWRSDGLTLGSELLALTDAPKYNSENVPRAAADRKRTAWLGVEVQTAGADIVREKKAATYLGRWVERAALVTDVISNTPAAKLGIKAGDILISARYPGSNDKTDLAMDYDYASSFNWSEIFDREGFEEFGGSGEVTPWPNVEGGVNACLTKFGVGSEVVIDWVSDGVRKEGKVTLELAPVHYANAPKARNKELGVTVCDMTHEVRKYFKFDDAASGVVIKKIKGAGPAAVAGLKPLELITLVNGEEVHSAKEFLEKTKGKTDLTFSVRRLTATRIVPIKLQDQEEEKK